MSVYVCLIINVVTFKIDVITQHQALVFLLSVPGWQDQAHLLSDIVELLGIYRKVVSLRRCEKAMPGLYSVLYPPGWCLLDHLEESHR